ncbi:MAG: fibronectin type III domain-containing protein [Treponema sp.]|jgi:hypothetical protein|nr:fibronectin type III domain-containing protein [Treponema sp.]
MCKKGFWARPAFLSAAFMLPVLLAVLLLAGCPGPTDPEPEPLPQPPAAPVITGISPEPSKLTFTWGAVSGAVSYEVCYNTDGTEPTAETTWTTTSATTVILEESLTDYTPYYVWIRAVNNVGASAPSGPVAVTPGNITIDNLMGYHQSNIQFADSNNEWYFTDDGFVIDENLTTFTYYEYNTGGGVVGFAGTIAGIIAEDPSSGPATDGRIFIKITNGGTWNKTAGSYYAVIYKNLTDSGVTEGGASKYGDFTAEENNGLPSLQEAITTYAYSTASDSGYFAYPAPYNTKTVLPGSLSALQGKWCWEEMYMVVKGNTFLSFIDGSEGDGIYSPDNEEDLLYIVGEIVDYIDKGASGILYVHTVVAGDSGYENEKFEAIAWKGLNGNNISFCAQMDSHSSIDDVKTAYDDPDNGDQFDPEYFSVYTK